MTDLKHNNTILINLLIVSIIPFLIWGPFFPDLIISISSLFFIYYTFKNNNFYYFNKRLVYQKELKTIKMILLLSK